MRCLLAQIGMGFDFLGMSVCLGSFLVCLVGLCLGVIGVVLGRGSGPDRRDAVVLGWLTLLIAVALWGVSAWAFLRWNPWSTVPRFVALFALANTCLALRLVFPSATRRLS